jgi:hypothetical protein
MRSTSLELAKRIFFDDLIKSAQALKLVRTSNDLMRRNAQNLTFNYYIFTFLSLGSEHQKMCSRSIIKLGFVWQKVYVDESVCSVIFMPTHYLE